MSDIKAPKYPNNVHQQFADYFNEPALKPYLYLLSEKLSEGHICIDLEALTPEEKEKVGLKPHSFQTLKDHPLVSQNEESYQPFILRNHLLYLQRYAHYEQQIYDAVKKLIAAEKETNKKWIKGLLSQKTQIENPHEIRHRTEWQLVAAISAALNNFTIITGGPGTGKTTTVGMMLSFLLQIKPDLKIALAAPTGKAAVRMRQSLEKSDFDEKIKAVFKTLKPTTIHRLLGYKKNSIYFQHNEDNPLMQDIIVIDESSMIDVALLAKLLAAINPDQTKIIFLGDKDQLSSVEAGSLFGDLCSAQRKLNLFSPKRADFVNQFLIPETQIKAENIVDNQHLLAEHIIELKFSHRFSDTDGIGLLSKATISNDQEIIKKFMDKKDNIIHIDQNYSEKVLAEFVKGFEEYIAENNIQKSLEKLKRLRILCAVRNGPQGIYAINQKVEQLLHKNKKINPNIVFYKHRPVMIQNNNYELGLFNGDVGIVREDENKQLKVWFEDEEKGIKSVLPPLIESVETCFAMTIHKSQGSEFDKVLVILPDKRDMPLLTRELLYTGITRAKKEVVIQSPKRVLMATVEKRVQRGSGIAGRF